MNRLWKYSKSSMVTFNGNMGLFAYLKYLNIKGKKHAFTLTKLR